MIFFFLRYPFVVLLLNIKQSSGKIKVKKIFYGKKFNVGIIYVFYKKLRLPKEKKKKKVM